MSMPAERLVISACQGDSLKGPGTTADRKLTQADRR